MIRTLDSRADYAGTTRQVVFDALAKQSNVFDAWISKVRDLSKHEKGDLFERLCQDVLRFQGQEVWRLCEVPEAMLERLAMRRADFGIDLIARDQRGFHAIQCKFRSGRLSWRELSTFDALVHRTGPWATCVVMTSAASVRRIGRNSSLDRSFCIGSFRRLPQEFWLGTAKLHGQKLGAEPSEPVEPLTPVAEIPSESDRERVARLRLAHFACPS